MFTHLYFGLVMSYKFDFTLKEIMSIPTLCLLLGKGISYLANQYVIDKVI